MKMEHKKKVIISCIIIAVILLLIGTVAVALHYKENNATGDASTETTNQDSTAPAVELKDSVIKIADFSEVIIEELAEVSDDSGYEVRVVGYEKVATLEEATEEYLAGLSGKTSGASVEGLDDSEPTEEGVYRIVFSFADMYENESLAEIYVVYDIPEGEEAGKVEDTDKGNEDVKDEQQSGGTTNKDETNKGDDKKPSGGTQQSGSTETQKPSGGGSGSSGSNTGSTESQKPSGGTQQGGGNSGSNTETQKPSGGSENQKPSGETENLVDKDVPLESGNQEAVSSAGLYKVTVSKSGQYCVMVKDWSESSKGYKLLEDFLAEMGYVPTGLSGRWLDSGEGYMVYCTGVEEKTTNQDGLPF